MGKEPELVTTQEAAAMLTVQSGHLVKPDYVRKLVEYGSLEPIRMDGRTYRLRRAQVAAIVVADHPGRKRKRARPMSVQSGRAVSDE